MDRRADTLTAPVEVASELCSRFRCAKSDCVECAAVCPVPGAIRVADEGAQVGAACLACGACVSACPNGAIRALEGDDRLADRIRRRVRPEESFRIGCAWAQDRVDIVVPCLSRLTEALMLEPVRGGASNVELLAPECHACGFRKAAPQWERTLAFARGLCESAGIGVDRLMRGVSPRGTAEEIPAPAGVPVGRRALFRAVAERWKESAAAPAEADASGQGASETFREIVQRHLENPKRAGLLDLLERLPHSAIAPKAVPAAGVPLGNPEVGIECTGCNVCETLCPVGALAHREEGGRYTLELDAALCTGCGVCEAACFHRAIRIGDMADLSVLFARPKTALIAMPRRVCPTCRESFLGGLPGPCPSCRLSGDRREAIVRRFFMGGNQSDQC